jgi:hypothetical protein
MTSNADFLLFISPARISRPRSQSNVTIQLLHQGTNDREGTMLRSAVCSQKRERSISCTLHPHHVYPISEALVSFDHDKGRSDSFSETSTTEDRKEVICPQRSLNGMWKSSRQKDYNPHMKTGKHARNFSR